LERRKRTTQLKRGKQEGRVFSKSEKKRLYERRGGLRPRGRRVAREKRSLLITKIKQRTH